MNPDALAALLAAETRWTRHDSGMRRIPGSAVLVLVLAVVASCGSKDVGWPAASDPIDVQGIAWVKGNTFGDARGPLFDVTPKPSAFVVAGEGIYYGAGSRIYYGTAHGVTDLGTVGRASTLAASPNRRWIAFIDLVPKRPAEAVVVDTSTGKEVLRTDKHMADENGGDSSDLYAENPPRIPQITDDVVWIEAPNGYLEYQLGSGRLVDHGSHPFKEKGDQILSPWWANRTEDGQGVWNPSREWYIDNASNRGALFAHKDGRRAHPRPRGEYYLLGWIDDATAYGVRNQQLVTCVVPTARCTDVPGAAGEGVVLPNSANWYEDVFLG